MKFFIDSGNIKDIESLMPLGIVDGITTNPSLLAKEKGDPRAHIKQICQIVRGPVSAEVVSTEASAMVAEGRELAAIDPHVVVKVPFTRDGVQALKALVADGIRVNVTLIFSPTQALISAKLGASYVSPFVGRLDDIASDGMRLVEEICTIFKAYQYKTEVLVASVRSPMHIVQAALLGAHVCTCPVAVLEQSLKHPLTDSGLKKFLEDWEKAKAEKSKA